MESICKPDQEQSIILIDSSQSSIDTNKKQNLYKNSCYICQMEDFFARKDQEFNQIYEEWIQRRKLRSIKASARPRALTFCFHCKKVFTRQELKRHCNIHHKREGCYSQLKINGKYTCQVCSDSHDPFPSRLNLKQHLATHTNEELINNGYSKIVVQTLPTGTPNIKQNFTESYHDDSSSLTSVSGFEEEKENLCSESSQSSESILNQIGNSQTAFSIDSIQSEYSVFFSKIPPSFKIDLAVIFLEGLKSSMLKQVEDSFTPSSKESIVFKPQKFRLNSNFCTGTWQNFKQMKYLQQKKVNDADQIQSMLVQSECLIWVMRDYTCTLQQALTERVISKQNFKRIFLQLAKTLQIIHENKVVHRCLHPSRIKIVSTLGGYSVFISDFSHSCYLDQRCSDDYLPNSVYLYTLNRDPVIKGQLLQDIYSFMVILLHYIVGQDFHNKMKQDFDVQKFCKDMNSSSILKRNQKWIITSLANDLQNLPTLNEIREKIKKTM